MRFQRIGLQKAASSIQHKKSCPVFVRSIVRCASSLHHPLLVFFGSGVVIELEELLLCFVRPQTGSFRPAGIVIFLFLAYLVYIHKSVGGTSNERGADGAAREESLWQTHKSAWKHGFFHIFSFMTYYFCECTRRFCEWSFPVVFVLCALRTRAEPSSQLGLEELAHNSLTAFQTL